MLDFLNIEHLDDGDVALEFFGVGNSPLKQLEKEFRPKMKQLENELIAKIQTFVPTQRDDGSDFSNGVPRKIFTQFVQVFKKAKSSSEWSRYQSISEEYATKRAMLVAKQSGTTAETKRFSFKPELVGVFSRSIIINLPADDDTGSAFSKVFETIVKTACKGFPNLRSVVTSTAPTTVTIVYLEPMSMAARYMKKPK